MQMEPKPRTFIVIGLAGSGKTTFCQRLYSWLNTDVVLKDGLNANITSINLDPAVQNPKMPLTVDIRDFVDFRETMEKYNLGPNGCTNTCLNIFLLNFKQPDLAKYTIIDTPGQIEAFTWSSPGEAIMELYRNTCIVYVVDLPLCKNKHVFINNMLFAAALKCRFKRPVLVVFNKKDLEESFEVEKWIRDYSYFIESLSDEENIIRGLALYFEEFYNNLEFTCLSALCGTGKEDFFSLVDKLFDDNEENKK